LPADLTCGEQTQLFFSLIHDGQKALQARRSFVPRTTEDPDLSDEARNKLLKIRRTMLSRGIYTELQKEFQALVEAENVRWHTALKRSHYLKILPILKQSFDFLAQLERTVIVLDEALKQNLNICACGESVAAGFAYLVGDRRVDYAVEEINIANDARNEGHACLLLNRNVSMRSDLLNSYQDALSVDPLNERIFFYQFVQLYAQDTCFKKLRAFNIELCASNRPPVFLDNEPQLERIKKAFNFQLDHLQESMRRLYRQRCPDETSEPAILDASAAASAAAPPASAASAAAAAPVVTPSSGQV